VGVNGALVAALLYLGRQIVKVRERVIRLEERINLLRSWPSDSGDDE